VSDWTGGSQFNVESLANIYRRGFVPLQIAAGVALDTGEKDDTGQPVMRAKYGLHALRHAAASLFIEQGFRPKRVQALMGHGSIQMTFDTYGHLFPSEKEDQEAMTQLQARLLA
jgi:integrase